MRTLVLGGIKSGKSRLAETFASETQRPVVYVATATPEDDEMQQRIAHHKQNRPPEWQLVEEPLDIGRVIEAYTEKGYCVLVDCLTLWLTNVLLLNDEQAFQQHKTRLLDAVSGADGVLILVSNETSMGVVPMGELTRRFCDEAGLLHQELAKSCGNVVLTVAGLPSYLKRHTDH